MQTSLRSLFGLALLLVAAALMLHPAPRAGAQETAPPAKPQAGSAPGPQEFVPGQLLVRFRPSAAQRVDRLVAAQAATRIGRIADLDIHLLRLPPGLPVEQAAEIFKNLPEVEFAEPNYIVHVSQINDPGLSNQWAPQQIGAPQAWSATEGDRGVVIAVVDTGVDYRHSELAPNMWANGGETPGNGVDDDGNGYADDIYGWDFVNNDRDPLDDHFHGTHVAGIAAAAPTDNPAGLVGICPRCRIMAVKVVGADGSGTLATLAGGITYAADNGARVINMSLGATTGSAALEAAVDYAWSRGLVVVAAAGNDGNSSRLYPAAYAHVIGVASTNSDDYRSCFSNYGDGYVSVAAPGELIYSTTLVDSAGKDSYAVVSGTSMATPHVAGLAGLLFSQNLGRTNQQVRDLIQSTARDLGPAGADAAFGAGRIDAYRAIQGDTTPLAPPAGLFTDDPTASGYAHARKLARDAGGALHLAWHGSSGGQYRVLYAVSHDDGATWSAPEIVFQSSAETFHPTLAVDSSYVYIAYPSKANSSNYQMFFTRKSLAGGSWSAPVAVLGGSYHAVRPDLYLDPSTNRLHLVASSYDDMPSVYYTASSNSGTTWSAATPVNVTSAGDQHTRYAAVHAYGSHIYVASRTVETYLLLGVIPVPRYRLATIRSLDGGATWSDRTELSLNDGTEYGASLAGVGDRLYLGYEQGGAVYFRRAEGGIGWSNAENLGSGSWPSLTQGDDGQAWAMWESSGSLLLRRYTGASWDSAETVMQGGGLGKGTYPNLKLGTGGGRVEWVATNCSGAPYRLMYDSRALSSMPTNPTLRLSAASYQVAENAGAAVVTLTLSAPSARQATVNYATSNGTATAGSDYTAKSGTLTFNPGETSKTLSVSITNDTRDEPDETFTLSLSNLVNVEPGTPTAATITIADDDLPPSVAFGGSTASVHENAGSAAITVRLSAASGYPVTVAYATGSGTATAGSDYTATSGTLTFNPGETSKTFSIPILEDTLGEANETVPLSLSAPSNATLGTPNTTTLTINANDTLTFSGASYSVNESAAGATITVRLNAPSSVAVTVNYTTSGGSATAGSDYTATSGTLTFNPGETSKTFSIPIVNDTADEPNETVVLVLSGPSNAALGTPGSATLTIVDND
jgi:thermitase